MTNEKWRLQQHHHHLQQFLLLRKQLRLVIILSFFLKSLKAISENIGKGTKYNNNLIADPGATLTKIVTRTRLSYPQVRHYLQLLAGQELVTVGVYQKKRPTKKGRKLKRSTVTTVKIWDQVPFSYSIISAWNNRAQNV